MKAYGIWSAMKAVYPMVGASADACKQNLVSSSFTGTFTSGWTFASTGATPNGTSAYMDTNFIPSAQYSNQDSAHISTYLRTSNTGGNIIFMGGRGSGSALIYILNFGLMAVNSTDTGGAANTSGTAFLLNNRINSTVMNQYENGTLLQNVAGASLGLPNGQIYLGGYNNNGSLLFPTSAQTAFASIGDGLTETQEGNFYTAVQAFQTTLARQV